MTGEWLLTNGLGGYALGPRGGGEPTRGYHGWLVAATTPPDGRVLLVSSIETTMVRADADPVRLPALDLAAGGSGGVELTARMVPDANAIVLTWRRDLDATGPVTLRLAPRLVGADHHPYDGRARPPRSVAIDEPGVGGDGSAHAPTATVRWDDDGPELRLAASAGRWRRVDRRADVTWPIEIARGTATGETQWIPLELEATLAPGDRLVLVLSTASGGRAPIPDAAILAADATSAAAAAASGMPAASPTPTSGDDWTRSTLDPLRAAARHFVVHRPDPRAPDPDQGVTVIAGYPWFGDWGRDTFISLEGLTLATGRHADAARILRTWAGLVRDGLLPNHFPEAGTPAYHAIDAPLWYVHALGAYEAATGDQDLPRELAPAVVAILDGYAGGTRFGIGMDADGLVRGGEPGLQLTWMDAKVDGTVMTPRHGKPVEIQALWIEANRLGARWARGRGDDAATARHTDRATAAAASFRRRFWRADLGWLNDVVDGPDGDDGTLRPNQLLALRLVPDLVPPAQATAILEAAERHLVVPGGVRTLAPFEPGYRDRFEGPPAFRDSAYHQGPAWTWLLGSWVSAVARHRGAAAGRAELVRALDALDPDRTGAVPELLEPEPPHRSRGCPWQAWGVAELLRCATELDPGRRAGDPPPSPAVR